MNIYPKHKVFTIFNSDECDIKILIPKFEDVQEMVVIRREITPNVSQTTTLTGRAVTPYKKYLTAMLEEQSNLFDSINRTPEVKNPDKDVFVNTPFGFLTATPSQNKEYPGIYVYLKSTAGDGNDENDLVLVEVDRDERGNPYLHAIVWGNLDEDDPTNERRFRRRGGFDL